MKLNTLPELFIHELQDLHSAETQLLEALPKMAKAATNPELKKAFENHLKETQGHAEMVLQVLGMLDETPGRTKCAAMAGIVKEGEEILKADGEDAVKDAAIISAAQRVEHYEMAGYGTARTLAAMLGHEKAAQILERILDQEHAADEKLGEISNSVNEDAVQVGGDGQGGEKAGEKGGKATGSSGGGSARAGGSQGGSRGGQKR